MIEILDILLLAPPFVLGGEEFDSGLVCATSSLAPRVNATASVSPRVTATASMEEC